MPELTATRPAATAPVDFETFMARLRRVTDPAKLAKAAAMLKAETFRLYARVEADHLVGVVKSQTNPRLVYSCRLGSDGRYGCGTQNLRACGGLYGSPCKHLLVLVIGLARAGDLDPTAAGETFLRYKGAEAGEIDWRPTETIPEDFYAV